MSFWRTFLGLPDVGTGRSLRLSAPRRLVCDLIHFAEKIPSVPVQKVVNIKRVIEARERAPERVSWSVIFAKAYALVCRETPALRRAYMEYPRPRLYEHPYSIASIAVERDYEGEPGVFFGYIPKPENLSLVDLDAEVRRLRTAPVEDVFRFALRVAKAPRLVRRFLWWYSLNVRGARKAQFFGTFGLTVYSSLGAESLHPLSPLTSTLNYGVIGDDGTVPVRVVYDHRVMDGATVARALARLEEVLNADIVAELTARHGLSIARPA